MQRIYAADIKDPTEPALLVAVAIETGAFLRWMDIQTKQNKMETDYTDFKGPLVEGSSSCQTCDAAKVSFFSSVLLF